MIDEKLLDVAYSLSREHIVLPRGSVSETRVGYMVRQGFHSGCFRKSVGEAYCRGCGTLISPT